MNVRRAPKRYLCCLLLIGLGIFGILLSPEVGMQGGIVPRSFTMNSVEEYGWGVAMASYEFELPYIQNQRGLLFMNFFLAGSLATLFSGVHWFTLLRKRDV